MSMIVLFPGGFKPPHQGHLDLALKYASEPIVDKVIILVGPGERDGIGRTQSILIWNMLLAGIPKVEAKSTDVPSPLKAAYNYIETAPPGTYALASSTKGDDFARVQEFVNSHKPGAKYYRQGVNVVLLPLDSSPILYSKRSPEAQLRSGNKSVNGQGISASVLRSDLAANDFEAFKTNYPRVDKNTVMSIYNLVNKKKKDISEIIFERAVLRTIVHNLLLEGGAAGHMAHPFDIESVKTGKDLINIFKKTANFLKTNEVPVKIDGVNSSIRLIDINGKKEFALDRGSNKPLDVKGITTADLKDRFGEGHGMIKTGEKVLEIFNQSLSNIQGELAKLGMIKNPNILLNIEYVNGKTNVQDYKDYKENFLAIHNLLEIKQTTTTTAKKTSTKRVTQEIPYSQAVLESMIKKLNVVANKSNFEVVGTIPARQKANANFATSLSTPVEVVLDPNRKDSKSLQQWLNQANNTKGQKLKLKDGKTVDALSKQVFLWINSGKPVSELIANPQDEKLAIDSFIIYLATIKLGDNILESLTSDLGDVKNQEGIVIRDTSTSSKPYKITGSFITRGLESAFHK